MARLTRKNQKVFAENATNNGVFGSLQAGNPTTSNDIEQIQSLPAYGQGWNAATMTSELLPPLEEFQAIQYMITRQMAYFFQEGIPEWGADVTFYEGSLTKQNISGGMRIYSSKTNENKGNPLSDTDKWQKVFDTSDPYAFTAWVTQQLALKEDLSNKQNNLENPDSTHYTTTKAVSDGIAALRTAVANTYQTLGNLINSLSNPSTTTYPTTQAVANAINSIDFTPYQTKSNLVNSLGTPNTTTYPTTQIVATNINTINTSLATKENVSNKVTNFNSPNNTTYPTTAAVNSRITSVMNSRTGFPNYNNVYALDGGAGSYTAPLDGYFTANIKFNRSSSADITIGNYNVYIGRSGADDSHGRWFGMPVKKGQQITWSITGSVYFVFLPFE